MILLKLNDRIAHIDAGELVGYQVNGHQYIHQKGSPGWRSADTEMFPIIGPTDKAGFKVKTPKGSAVQDQHGLLREMDYGLEYSSDTEAVFSKRYLCGTAIENSKFPDKSTAETLSWPYDFSFLKKFELTADGLQVTFKVSGDGDMPFMLGYHPAFKLYSKNPIIKANHKEITLAEVLEVGSRAMPVLGCTELTLVDKKQLTLKTEGFGNFMLWTEVSNMICLEPITFYPYAVEQGELHKGFERLSEQPSVFKLRLSTAD